MSDEEYERSLAYVAGMREAAKILRSCELYNIAIHDPDDAVAWHRRSIAQRIEREAARLEKVAAVEYEGTCTREKVGSYGSERIRDEGGPVDGSYGPGPVDAERGAGSHVGGHRRVF